MNTWVDYIRGDLQAHIAAGGPLPAPLTLHGLSGHYAVSMTPIRRAVRELIADGYLAPGERPAGRQFPPPGPCGEESAARPGAAPRLFQRDPPLAGQLSLAGRTVFVREEETAERVAVSTTAVRHVFHELAGAGLLEHVPRRGWRLHPSAARSWTITSASANSWSWRPWRRPGRASKTNAWRRSTRATCFPAARTSSRGSTARCTTT